MSPASKESVMPQLQAYHGSHLPTRKTAGSHLLCQVISCDQPSACQLPDGRSVVVPPLQLQAIHAVLACGCDAAL
jgi:hypothetical protein